MKESTSESIKGILIVAFFALVVFSYVFVTMGQGVCDTPFGANDLRCIGHFR